MSKSRDERWRAQRRASTNFVNDMTVIEEHYLDLEEATAADTGVYICRVSEQNHLIWSHSGRGCIGCISKYDIQPLERLRGY